MVSEEAGLRFFPVREEQFDLCYAAADEGDPRIRALLRAVRSPSYRRLLGELPGFDPAQAGEVRCLS
jgi:molybdate-binding protein